MSCLHQKYLFAVLPRRCFSSEMFHRCYTFFWCGWCGPKGGKAARWGCPFDFGCRRDKLRKLWEWREWMKDDLIGRTDITPTKYCTRIRKGDDQRWPMPWRISMVKLWSRCLLTPIRTEPAKPQASFECANGRRKPRWKAQQRDDAGTHWHSATTGILAVNSCESLV